jgi:hypothetical protein
MACFTLGFLEQLLIWLVVLIAVVSIVRLVIPWLLNFFGLGGIVAQIIMIVLWAVVAIIGIRILFLLAGCLIGTSPHLFR